MSTEGAPSESDNVQQLKMEIEELRAQVVKLRKEVSEKQKHEEELETSLSDTRNTLGDALQLLAADPLRDDASSASGSPSSDPSSIPKRCPSPVYSPVYEAMGWDRGEWIVRYSPSESEKSPSDVKSSKGVCVRGQVGAADGTVCR